MRSHHIITSEHGASGNEFGFPNWAVGKFILYVFELCFPVYEHGSESGMGPVELQNKGHVLGFIVLNIFCKDDGMRRKVFGQWPEPFNLGNFFFHGFRKSGLGVEQVPCFFFTASFDWLGIFEH